MRAPIALAAACGLAKAFAALGAIIFALGLLFMPVGAWPGFVVIGALIAIPATLMWLRLRGRRNAHLDQMRREAFPDIHMPMKDGSPPRPVRAVEVSSGRFMVIEPMPRDERWAFDPGSTVRCEERRLPDGTTVMMAVAADSSAFGRKGWA